MFFTLRRKPFHYKLKWTLEQLQEAVATERTSIAVTCPYKLHNNIARK
jgi:hypothetical protein